MSEDNVGRPGPDERLERELRELGPIILRRQRAEAEGVDAAFALVLERRLLGEENVQAVAIREPAAQPPPARRTRFTWPAIAAAALVAAAVILTLVSRQHSTTNPHVALAPRPSTADLIRNYPSFEVGGGGGWHGISHLQSHHDVWWRVSCSSPPQRVPPPFSSCHPTDLSFGRIIV